MGPPLVGVGQGVGPLQKKAPFFVRAPPPGPLRRGVVHSSVGSESAPHFNMSLWSWVRALTEAKEKGMGHAPIACEWDHPSSEWARGWGPYKNFDLDSFFFQFLYNLSIINHFHLKESIINHFYYVKLNFKLL